MFAPFLLIGVTRGFTRIRSTLPFRCFVSSSTFFLLASSSSQKSRQQLASTNYLRVDPKIMSSTEPKPTNIDLPEYVFPFTEDKYDGAIVSSKSLPATDEEFEKMLDHSLIYWKSIHRRGIWMKILIEKSSFIPLAVKRGFVFHHAEKTYAMLTHWLADSESRLPPNASHQVGVGCLVIDKDGKILLVQEKSGPLRGTGVWKLPTGLVEQGEDISAAAEREVWEETGIKAKFLKLLSFRQAHGALFGKSDLFFVCVLAPETSEISPQEVEIHACEWKEPEVYFQQAFFQNSPLHSFLNTKIRSEINSFHGQSASQPAMEVKKFPLGFRPGEASLYFYPQENTSNGTTSSEEK